MLDGMISAMTPNYMYFLGSGVATRQLGTAFQTVVPYRVFDASDGAFSIAVGSEKLWAAFCPAIGREELAAHPDFATNPARVRNRPALEAILADVFRHRPVEEWVQRLHGAGIPCSPVRNFVEVSQQPSAINRRFAKIRKCQPDALSDVCSSPLPRCVSDPPSLRRLKTPLRLIAAAPYSSEAGCSAAPVTASSLDIRRNGFACERPSVRPPECPIHASTARLRCRRVYRRSSRPAWRRLSRRAPTFCFQSRLGFFPGPRPSSSCA